MSPSQKMTSILNDYLFDPITSEKQWNDLIQLKKRLWIGDVDGVRNCTYLHPEIAASWIRSYEYGVNPYGRDNMERCPEERLEPAKQRHEDLGRVVEFSKPIMTAFLHWMGDASCLISLDDNFGYPMLLEGNAKMRKRVYSTLISTAETCMGTNTHDLVRRLKKPVLLQGPQNYYIAENRMVSGAPILDSKGEIIAILVLTQDLPPCPWSTAFQAICTHILSLINAMAFAIQNQILLAKSIQCQHEIAQQLSVSNHILSTTLNIVEDGIATIDNRYHFLNINKKARQWLQITDDDIGKLDIRDFLANPKRFERLVTSRHASDYEDVLKTVNKSFQIEAFPINGISSGIANGTVLKFSSLEKINSVAAKRAGTQALFSFCDLIGESREFQSVVKTAMAFARSAENVLLIGESGTGKELFAQAIHNEFRPSGPFVAINCAAMPRDLIASELFGYESGSFTGADKRGRPGKFELAQNGTLFLDEIGDMPIELQSVLLRVLQNREVTRIGAQHAISVNCKIVAATNKNILDMVKAGTFRDDLYYRLSILKIAIPPLRDRKEDIKQLSNYFLENYSSRVGIERKQISNEALAVMQAYDWPGNVRQLENSIIYSVNSCAGVMIGVDDLYPDIMSATGAEKKPPPPDAFRFAPGKHQIEVSGDDIIQALSMAGNNVSKAAVVLGISRSTLYRRLRAMGLIQNAERSVSAEPDNDSI